jgi:uncharacterized membrane protein
MNRPPGETDAALEHLERQLGRLLNAGVLLAAIVLALGLILWFAWGSGRPASLTLTVGLVILMLTPLARVVASFVVYWRLRDWFFVGTTVMVFVVLVGAWLLKS